MNLDRLPYGVCRLYTLGCGTDSARGWKWGLSGLPRQWRSPGRLRFAPEDEHEQDVRRERDHARNHHRQ